MLLVLGVLFTVIAIGALFMTGIAPRTIVGFWPVVFFGLIAVACFVAHARGWS